MKLRNKIRRCARHSFWLVRAGVAGWWVDVRYARPLKCEVCVYVNPKNLVKGHCSLTSKLVGITAGTGVLPFRQIVAILLHELGHYKHRGEYTRSRRKNHRIEFRADRHAAVEGYGRPLIDFFKLARERMGEGECKTHPGFTKRIKALERYLHRNSKPTKG